MEVGRPPVVTVNDQTLPPEAAVQAFGVHYEGSTPILTLAVAANVRIAGEGVVYVRTDGAALDGMREFIEGLDEEELDRQACEMAPTLNSRPAEGYKAAILAMLAARR